MPSATCLPPPYLDYVPAERACLMTFAKYLAIGGGNGQSRRWDLSHPKVGGQHCACLCDIGSRLKR
jgi:hypothetical protein